MAALPTRILMRLRSGSGRPLRSVQINGKRAIVVDGDLVELPRGSEGNFHLVGRFE